MEHPLRIVAVSLAFEYEHKSVDEIDFTSKTSFLDYDLLIWDPNYLIDEYLRLQGLSTNNTYRGYPSLDDDNSTKIINDIGRRTDEINAMLELGRSVVIFMPEPQKFYIATGEKEYSG